jgi:hypothetical protein
MQTLSHYLLIYERRQNAPNGLTLLWPNFELGYVVQGQLFIYKCEKFL